MQDIARQSENESTSEGGSILDTFLENVEARGSETAARTKRNGKYVDVTWTEVWDSARQVALSLVALGIEPGERINVMAHTSLRWVEIDVGILAAAAVTVAIYPSNLPSECQYIIDDCDGVLVFAQDAEQVAKFVEIKDNLPNVKKIVQMSGDVASDVPADWVLSWSDFLAVGKEQDEAVLEERRKMLSPDSILTLIYTSGTTGLPKGVVLTHGNMIYEGKAIREVDVVRSSDVQLIFLPLAHVFAKVLEVGWFSTGHIMAFAENMTTIRENLGETRPTLMAGVPRIFEKFYSAVVEKATAEPGLKTNLFHAALDLSQKRGEAEERGEELGLIDSLKFSVLRKLVFSKVGEGLMEILGGRMRIMVSGGAPLAKKIAWFFRDAGLTIVEGYGMTESSAATCINLPHRNHIGTVGPVLPGTELKIAEDGEILIKGPGVMREYWKKAEATEETLNDGWLLTGDIGEIDPVTKALRITDRKKDLIVTAGGKNVAPQKIENLIKTKKLISQVVVHGDKRKFLSALLTLDEEILKDAAKEMGISGTYAELTQKPEVEKAVRALVDEANSELASYETVKKFKILETDFSVETGELTPKLSIKRKVVNEKYGHFLDEFYQEKY